MRAGRAQLKEAYVYLRGSEAFLIGAHISPLPSTSSHVVARSRAHAQAPPEPQRALRAHRRGRAKRLHGSYRSSFTGRTAVPSSRWASPRARSSTTSARWRRTATGQRQGAPPQARLADTACRQKQMSKRVLRVVPGPRGCESAGRDARSDLANRLGQVEAGQLTFAAGDNLGILEGRRGLRLHGAACRCCRWWTRVIHQLHAPAKDIVEPPTRRILVVVVSPKHIGLRR